MYIGVYSIQARKDLFRVLFGFEFCFCFVGYFFIGMMNCQENIPFASGKWVGLICHLSVTVAQNSRKTKGIQK